MKKKQEIVSLRAKIDKLKEEKKKRIETLNRNIKSTTSASSKENYRKTKIKESDKYDREIENIKRKVDDIKKEIEYCKKMIASLKT